MMKSTKQFDVSQASKPGDASLTEALKKKFPIFLMPFCLILIVYVVDGVIFKLTSSTTDVTDGATSGFSPSILEITSIVLCILLPGIIFKSKQKKGGNSEGKMSATSTSINARQKSTKQPSPRENSDECTTAKIKSLSETLKSAEDEASMQKQALSKQAAALARWNQAISNAAKAGMPHKAVELLAEIESRS